MNKLIIILMFLTISVFLYGQEIVVQSTNRDDYTLLTQYKNSPEVIEAISKLKTVINANPDYKGKNMKVIVKVTFYNPKNNILPLNRVDVYSDNFYIWGGNTNGISNRIILNFLFKEESSGNSKKLEFDDFQYQESGGDEQVPELVADYIKDNILRAQNNDVEKIIKKGLNAVKNAFDRSFQDELIKFAPKMLLCRYYYKEYSCRFEDTYSDYFQNATTNRTAELQQSVVYLNQDGQYDDVFLNNWKTTRANVFDALLGHELWTNNITPPSDMLYVIENNNYKQFSTLNLIFNTENLFDYSQTGLSTFDKIQTEFKFIETLKNSKNVMTMDLDNSRQLKLQLETGNSIPVSVNTLYKLIKDVIHGPKETNLINAEDNDNVNHISKEQIWGHQVWTSYQTWCNVFAQYLSRHVYGMMNGDFLVPSRKGNMNANALYDYFDKSSDFIDLNKEGYTSDKIWIKLINKGYPVYFAWKNPNPNKSGHIETGFPPNNRVSISNKRFFDGESSQTRLLNSGDTKYMVGAGGTVGFKSFEGYFKDFTNKATPFLTLQYLKNEY